MIGIYKITNTVNGKCYIGQSKDLIIRIQKHIKTLLNGTNRNEHLQNAYNTYGTGNFTIEIIEECSEENLDEREIYWIDFYKSYDRECGYNKTKGGTGGNSYYELLSDDEKEVVKQKINGRQAPNKNTYCYTDGIVIKYIEEKDIEQYEADGWYRGVPEYIRNKEKLSNMGDKNGFYGKQHSDDTKTNLSEGRRGDKNWNYGKLLYHKDSEQKYIAQEDVIYYECLGWTKGPSETTKKKISENNKGKKMPAETIRRRSVIYTYNGEEYVGWRKLQAHLRENGYPKISEIAIVKLSNGTRVRGYDELFQKIIIKEEI